MIYTLIFGAAVGNEHTTFGKLQRIILDNGIANQFTVDPGLLGYERVVPINEVLTTNDEKITLSIGDDEWKMHAAYKMERALGNPNDDQPELLSLTPNPLAAEPGRDADQAGDELLATEEIRTVSNTSVVLTAKTIVEIADGTSQRLRGIVADTGRPQQLLLEQGAVAFEAVTQLDEQHIRVAGRRTAATPDAGS